MKYRIILALTLFAAVSCFAQPTLRDRNTGKYLGNLSANPYDANSTSNPYGRFGSQYSQDSVNNQFGRYGSRYSNESVNNPYATSPPVVVMPCYGC